MTDYLSMLPAELFPQIFDDLSMDDLLTSLCFVNKRLRALCLSYPRLAEVPDGGQHNIMFFC